MIPLSVVSSMASPLVCFIGPGDFMLHTTIGLSFGLLLFLVASGFTLTFGLARFVNLAHGATFMVAAQVAASVAADPDRLVLAVLAATGVGAAITVAVFALAAVRWQQIVADPTKQVLVTFGCLLVIADLARARWGGVPRTVLPPSALDGSVSIGETMFPVYRLVVMGAGVVTAAGLWWLTERTRFGAAVRAGVDDKEQLEAMGIRASTLYLAVFTLAGALAGLAGGLGAPVLGASMGQEFTILILALVAVVVGGLGSLGGAFIASLVVGLVDAYGKALIPELSSFTMMTLVVVVLAVRPHGLMTRSAI